MVTSKKLKMEGKPLRKQSVKGMVIKSATKRKVISKK